MRSRNVAMEVSALEGLASAMVHFEDFKLWSLKIKSHS